MSIYVDSYSPHVPVKWRGGGHMHADSHDELMQFASRIGMKPQWLQHAGRPTEHFDLTARRKAVALRLGAIEMSSREIARMMRERVELAISARKRVTHE